MQRLSVIALALICGLAAPACDRKSEKQEPAKAEVEKESAEAVGAPKKEEPNEAEPEDEAADDEQADEQADEPVDEVEREEKYPDLSPEKRAARSANDFGHALFGRLGEGNVALSPVSISTAVAMAYAGAGGQTAQELAEVMQYPNDAVAGFGALSQALDERDEKQDDEDAVALQLVNDIWVEKTFDVQKPYRSKLEEHYGAVPRQVDFQGAPNQSQKEINAYVAEATRDKIPQLIPGGIIDESTRVVLTNAVYLNAGWMEPFDERETKPGAFAAPDGKVRPPMMRQTAYFDRAGGEGYEVLEMPYMGGKLAALVVLPDEGKLDEVQETFDSETFASTIDDLESSYVNLTLPKFKVRRSSSLVPILREMGATLPFVDGADFDAIGPRLSISDILHETFIDVHEKGTEAAAATAVVMHTKSMPPKPTSFVVDRPFLFYIYDKPTGAILFAARVVDPTK